MKVFSAFAGAVALVALNGSASAATVTLEPLNLPDATYIQTASPGYGSSGPVTLNWDPNSDSNTALRFWNDTYSGRDAAWCGSNAASGGCLLDLLVSTGSAVTLNSFRLGGYLNADRSIAYTVTDLATSLIVASGTPTVSGTTGFTAAVNATSNGGFRIAFGPDGYDGGINDIDYAFSAAVPEAATWAMMIAGLGMMGAALRRKRPAEAMFEAARS